MTAVKIESSSNAVFKQTKKLLKRSERKKTGLFIIEGERIVNDAVKKGARVEYLVVSEFYGGSVPEGIKTYVLADRLFDELKETVNSQGIAAVVNYTQKKTDEINYEKYGCYLYLDCVADPGNMGTIIRSAEAFGADGIILSDGCVDVYNPKVIRSTMSALFDVDLYCGNEETIKKFLQNGFEIAGTFPTDAEYSYECDYSDKCVIVMGNEANGICDKISALCTKKVTIPMTKFTESLNVSVACGIMLYERFIYGKRRGKKDE